MKNIKRRRSKRVYFIRTIFILLIVSMLFLMWCGCLYIHQFFTKDTFSERSEGHSRAAKQTSCVVIDAGHGGNDGGAAVRDVLEKDINLSVAQKLKKALEKKGIRVIMTRDTDTELSLSERADIANKVNADLFISLHCNYYENDAEVSGLECYYCTDSDDGRSYAESITDAVRSDGSITVRDIRSENYYVLKNTEMPAVLIEMGFLSNPSECNMLSSKDHQDALSQKIAEGVLKQISNLKKEEI